jgi:type II secretory pathway predicted ATPase ExeA
MYNEHFGLQQAPFRITPDTRIFYPGGGRGEILDALVYAITSGEGIIKVVGEVGTGKTMLCRMLEERLPEQVDFVYLANPSLAPDDIIQAIALEMALEYPANANRLHIMHALQQRLLEKHAQNRQVVVFIEEAQSMPIETLEEIRLLSNLETKQEKLLQIVLFGQPELDEYLDQVNIRQLRERITHSFYLEPFGRNELQKYVNFRMRAAGYRGREAFRSNVYTGMERASEGLIRRINILADKALLAAYAEGVHDVSRKHVRKAIDDSQFEQRRRSRAPEAMMALGLVMVVISVTLTFWGPGRSTFESLLAGAARTADSVNEGSAPEEMMASAAGSDEAREPAPSDDVSAAKVIAGTTASRAEDEPTRTGVVAPAAEVVASAAGSNEESASDSSIALSLPVEVIASPPASNGEDESDPSIGVSPASEMTASAADSVSSAQQETKAAAHDLQAASSDSDAADLVAEPIGEVSADATVEPRPSVSAVAKAEPEADSTSADLAAVTVASSGTEAASRPAPAETIALASSSTGPAVASLGTDEAASGETGPQAAAAEAFPEASTKVAGTEAANDASGPGDANDGAAPEAVTTLAATETMGSGADSDQATGGASDESMAPVITFEAAEGGTDIEVGPDSAAASITLAATEAGEGEAGFQESAGGDPSEAVTPESTVLAAVADVGAAPEAADWMPIDAANTADGLLASRMVVTKRWLASADGEHFTIQLLLTIADRRRQIEEFLVERFPRGKIEHLYVYETVIKKKPYVGVLYGEFSTSIEAKQAKT